jgi:hypothetical protein
MMNKMSNAGLGNKLARKYIWEVYRALGLEVAVEADGKDGLAKA